MIDRWIAEATECEFKASLETRKPKSWLKSISAFANGIGGTLIFGIGDHREVVGLSDIKQDAATISELIKARISPIPDFVLTPVDEDGMALLVVEIRPGADTPYSYKADGVTEAYVRIGDESIVAPDYMLRELILKGTNRTYDTIVSDSRKADYSFTLLEATYLERTRLRFEATDYVSFGLTSREGFLTNAGRLFADQHIVYNARLFCTRWNGLVKGSVFDDALDDKEYAGNLIYLLKSGTDFVRNNSRVRFEKKARYRIDKPDYAERAVTEALVNALIHRDYLILGSEVHIDMFDDRLEITSPGGMYTGVPIQELGLENIGSVRRNPIIADLFHRMKFMERRGSGIRKILDETSKLPGYTEDSKPIFRSTATAFCVTIKNVNYPTQQAGNPVSDQDAKSRILAFCETARSKREICEHLGFTNLTHFTRTYLKPLLDNGLLSMTVPEKPSSKNQKYIRL